MKKLLVVGGTGFIGYHVIKEAKKRNFKVSSISKNKPKIARRLKGIKYIYVDFSKYDSLKKKLNEKYDFVINAGGYGINPDFGKEGDKLIYSHFQGLINLLKILPLKKVKKFVQIGSSAEYGNLNSPIKETANCLPRTPYSIAKYLCTKHLINLSKKYKYSVTVFRLFQVYGPKQDKNRVLPYLIDNCRKNKVFPTTKGNQLCDFCFIDDVVLAIFKSLTSKKSNCEIINLGLGKPIKIKFLINMVKKLLSSGKPKLGGLKYKKGINMNNFPNIQKAKKILNWRPTTSLLNGITKTISS
tara:strand:+ start:1061 stop:1957 length:897 start_codon:yes stop_codon:yes gene_type:complete